MAGRALIVTDGKAGHENQSRACARSLGLAAEIAKVEFKSRLHKSLSYVLDRVGVATRALFRPFDLPGGDFRVVIGTGSGTFYAVKTIAREIGAKSVAVLYPRGYRVSGFDCVLAPSFDEPAAAANVVELPANLVAADADFYKAGVAAFRERHAFADGARAVAVIVGGPNKCASLGAEWMRAQLERVFADNPDVEKWVTTSRRTPPEVEAVVDSFPFDYKLVYSRDHFNPIPAFVSLAKRLYVTAESTGMLSEACTFGGAEVVPLDNLKPGRHKFRRFAESCAAMGARKFDFTKPFNKTKEILCL